MAERQIAKKVESVWAVFPLDPLDGGVKSEDQPPQPQADLLTGEKVEHEANAVVQKENISKIYCYTCEN